MNIQHAVFSLFGGYRVRRDGWPEGRCLEWRHGLIVECEQPGDYAHSTPFLADTDDLIAVDWVLCRSSDQKPMRTREQSMAAHPTSKQKPAANRPWWMPRPKGQR